MGAQFGFRDLKAYQLAFKLAMEIFQSGWTSHENVVISLRMSTRDYEELGRMLGGMIERPEAFHAQTLKRRKP
jgi:hypothetical protein